MTMKNISSSRSVVAVFFLLALLLVTCIPNRLMAIQCSAGPYKIDVDVRSSLMKIIPHAFVKCTHANKTIKISASAPGYVPQKAEILIKPGVKFYNKIIQLADPKKRLDALDFNHKPIVSAYFDRFQGNTPTDRYAITLFLPIKSWPHPISSNVKVNQPGYGWPIQESCEISTFEDFYRVHMLVNRAVLDDPNDELLIYINTNEILEVNVTPWWILTVANLEVNDPYAAEQLARVLIFVLPESAFARAMPETLVRLLAQKKRFFDLHENYR